MFNPLRSTLLLTLFLMSLASGHEGLAQIQRSGGWGLPTAPPGYDQERGTPKLHGIQAALNWGEGTVYFFNGGVYTKWILDPGNGERGFPRIISGDWPDVFGGEIDAALEWTNGKAYFFRGNQYIRYDTENDRSDPGYPKTVNNQTWPGL